MGNRAMKLSLPITVLAALGLPQSDDRAPALMLADTAAALDVECSYLPPDPGCHTLPNGDPGYPGAPAEIEIERIACRAPLLWQGDGIALAVSAGTDLLPLLSGRDIESLQDQVAERAKQARRDDAAEALIELPNVMSRYYP